MNFFVGSSFVPKPEVDVGVVRLVPKRVPAVKVSFAVFEKVTRTVFAMRQKHCKNPLRYAPIYTHSPQIKFQC